MTSHEAFANEIYLFKLRIEDYLFYIANICRFYRRIKNISQFALCQKYGF